MGGGGGHSSCNASLSQPNVQETAEKKMLENNKVHT